MCIRDSLQIVPQPHERRLHRAHLALEHLGKRDGTHGLVGHEEHRLQGARQLVFLQSLRHVPLLLPHRREGVVAFQTQIARTLDVVDRDIAEQLDVYKRQGNAQREHGAP